MAEQYMSLYDENGELLDKETLMQKVSDFYDNIQKTAENEDEDFLEFIVKSENHINTETLANTVDFIDKNIYLFSDITREVGEDILRKIKTWNSIDDKDNIPVEERAPINIYIDSNGGDVVATLLIIDAIKNSKTPVYTYCMGAAYSGGFFILISGHKKFGTEHSSYMFHEGSCALGGDASKVDDTLKYYKFQRKQLKKLVLNNTNITEENYNKHIKDDWYFDAGLAKKLNVINEILTDNGYTEEEND